MTPVRSLAVLFFASLLAGFSQIAAGQEISDESRRTDKNVIAELAAKSDFVIVGEVLRNHSEWYRKSIVTISEVAPLSVMKGEVPAKTVTVIFFGGTVGVVNQDFTHEATLREGEVAVLFLAKPRDEASRKYQALRFIGEEGKIPLLNPGDSKARLEDNERLVRFLADLKTAVSGGRQQP